MIGECIATARKNKGMKQIDLANKIGVSVDTIRRWEQNKRSLSIDMAKLLSRILDISPDCFWGDESDEERLMSQEIPQTESAISPSIPLKPELHQTEAKTEMHYKGDLYYKFPDGGELSLPAKPEYTPLFEKMVAQRLAGKGSEMKAV